MRCLFPLILLAVTAEALENGLARTPPMGWMSWAAFFCEVDCVKYPTACINEQLYKDMADRLAEDGFRDAGYTGIHMDDCWMEKERDSTGKLVANRTRFPSGVKSLTQYMHDRGLLFGIYEDVGLETCARYPGSQNHYEADATTFAEWECDYLKFDGCNYPATLGHVGYPAMQDALNKTSRPMVYSCEWPLYLKDIENKINYTEIAATCNLWRNFNDVASSWKSIHNIIKFYNKEQDKLIAVHGPGAWNDPDMLVGGTEGVSLVEAKTQMTVWSIWAAPLIMSNDLRTLQKEFKDMYLNKDVIAVDQDPLGKMGRLVYSDTLLYVYVKPMNPIINGEFSYAIAVVNYSEDHKVGYNGKLNQLGLNCTSGYQVKELWSGQDMGILKPMDWLRTGVIDQTDSRMYKATVVVQ